MFIFSNFSEQIKVKVQYVDFLKCQLQKRKDVQSPVEICTLFI